MVRMEHGLFYLAVAALCGCVQGDLRTPATVSPSEIANMADGSVVRVRGYLVFESPLRQLWSSQRAYTESDFDNCVTLINTQPYRERLTEKSRSITIIAGRSFRDVLTGRVDYGACSQVGLLVESVEGAR